MSRTLCSPGAGGRVLRFRRRRVNGLSIIFVAIALVGLVGFVSLAVDIGRQRLAKAQNQTAADGAALAAADALKNLPATDGVDQVIDAAVETAAENPNLNQSPSGRRDTPVTLVPSQDVQFGIWRNDSKTFEVIEDDGTGGVDQRRQANAVRVFARRGSTFQMRHSDGSVSTITRNTGVPLIFGPVLGVFTGNLEQPATSWLAGGQSDGWGFVGIDSVKLNGTTMTDSYNSATETYPGVGGPNDKGGVASNGDVTLVGTVDIHGDAHPGTDGNIMPQPLGSNVDVTGFMNPLPTTLSYPPVAYTPPSTGYNPPNSILPLPTSQLIVKGVFTPKSIAGVTLVGATTKPSSESEPAQVLFRFSGWKAVQQSVVTIKGNCDIYLDGDFDQKAGGLIQIVPADNAPTEHPRVRFFCNGNFNDTGGTIINNGLPSDLTITDTKPGTSVDIGGAANFSGHVYAPQSDVTIHGNPGFFGWCIGETLTVMGTSNLHYDETRQNSFVDYKIHLVK